MIKTITEEYREGVLAVRKTTVYFLGIPVYKRKDATTNNHVVVDLTPIRESKQIKGFRNETKN